jgi:DNA-binding SARP family transcriptional activator/tetratricopeptide (TPR) repeat protein
VLRIALLGEPHFSFRGEPYRFEALPRAMPLLAYLILKRAHPESVDAVATLLWPEDRESDARVKLRRHVSVLQAALPPEDPAQPWFHTTGDTLQWNCAADSFCDLIAFEEDAANLATYDAAVALYGGEFLVGYHTPWIEAERDRLRRIVLFRREALMALAEDEARSDDAMRHARAILAIDPWRESAVRSLMRELGAQSDYAGAAAEFDRFALRLRRERLSGPTAETRALLRAFVGDRATPARAPFIGRKQAQASLEAAFADVRGGRGMTLFLIGERSSGKAEFAEAFADGCAEARVFIGRLSAREGRPYESIASVLRTALPYIREIAPPGEIAALAALLPEVGRALPRTHVSDVDRERRRIDDGIARAFSALARSGPLVIVLPDVHRAGYATIAALESLAKRIADEPVLILATASSVSEPLGSAIRRLTHVGRATTVKHEATGSARSETFAATPPLAVQTVSPVQYAEIARAAVDVFADDDARIAIERGLHAAQDDATRYALLIQQARMATVGIGRAEHVRLLGELAGMATDPRRRAQVLQLRIRCASAAGDAADRERFVDEFTTLANDLNDEQLIARARLARGQARCDGEKFSAARIDLIDASDRALALNAVTVAFETLLTLAEMEASLGNAAAAYDYLKRADREAEHAGDLLGQAQIVGITIGMLLGEMRMSEAIATADAAEPLFAAFGDRETHADIRTQVARALTRTGHIDRAMKIYRSVAEVYRELNVPRGEAKTLINSSITLMRLGSYDEALASVQRAAAIFERIGDVRGHAICLSNAGLIAYYRHRYDDAVHEYERALALALKLGNEDIISNITSNLGAADSARWNYERAIDFLERGIRMATARDRVLAVVNDIPDLVLAYMRRGDSRRAEMTSRTMLEVVARLTDPYDEMYYVEYVAGLVDDRRSLLSSARAHYEVAERLFLERVASFTDEASRAAFIDLPNSRLIREGLKLR